MIAFSSASFADEKKKIVFLADGGKNSKTHAHESGNALLANALEESGLGFETSLHKGWPTDAKAFDGADCVVIFCNGGGGHLVMKHLDQFEKLIDDGVGIVCMHYAVEVPKGRSGDLMLDATGGYFETHWSVNPHWKAEITTLPKHPITRGVKPFTQDDEWYYHMRFQPEMKGVTPILSAHPPQSTMKRKDGPHSNNPHVRKAAGLTSGLMAGGGALEPQARTITILGIVMIGAHSFSMLLHGLPALRFQRRVFHQSRIQ